MNRNPYAAPNAVVADVSPAGHNTNFSKWVRGILYLELAVSVVAVVSGFLEYELLSAYGAGTYESEADAVAAGEANDKRQRIVGIAQIAIAITSGILILTWIYRANAEARRRGASGMKFTPGWSVGWYFIPFANLWKPYQAMREIWLASANPRNWEYQERPTILAWWWFLWIFSNMLSNASLRLSLRAEDLDQFIAVNIVTLAANLVSVPLCVLFVVVVSRIDAMQSTEQTEDENQKHGTEQRR